MRSQAKPLRRIEMIAGYEQARPEHDKEWRGIEKQHGARRGRPNQPAIDQEELNREKNAGDDAGLERAVALEQRNSAQPRLSGDAKSRHDRTDRRLNKRRDVVNRELDGDLIEAPGQTQPNGYRDGERIERTGLWGLGHEGSGQFAERRVVGSGHADKAVFASGKQPIIARDNGSRCRRFRSPGFSA